MDLAAGLGRNALFAARNGYEVDAVDISHQALQRLTEAAQEKGLPVNCIEADLDAYRISERAYDLILVFQFFSPSLMASLEQGLKPGGLLFYSTFNHRHLSQRPEFNPAYLVPTGGLAPFFTQLEILLNEPEGGTDGNLARLIGRKAS